ncbi:hypothetical protein [Serratia fonticola]
MEKNVNFIYSTPSKSDGTVFPISSVTCAINLSSEWDEYVKSTLNFSTWEVLYKKEDKNNLMMMILGELVNNGKRRTNENIKSRSGLVLDYDNGDMTFEDIQKDLEKYEYILYSSPSYGKKDGDRCRIVIPFDVSMTADEWNDYKESFKSRFPYIDSSCFTISQGQNITAYFEGIAPYAYYNNSGYFMNPFNDIEYIESKVKVNDINFDEVTIPDDELKRVFDAFVEQNRGGLSRSQAWFFAQVMKAYGVYDYHRVSMVQHRDANTHPTAFFKNTAKTPLNVCMLKNYLPKDFTMPASYNFFTHVKDFDNLEEVKIEAANYHIDYEISLKEDEYLSDVTDKFVIKDGINLLIADCGSGKTHYWSKTQDTMMACPLLSIVSQNKREGAEFNNIEDGVATYQQLKKIYNNKDSYEKYSRMTLIIDEAHGLYLDGYKQSTNNMVHKCLPLFKSVVLMSGTIRPEYFSNLKIDNVIRVHKKQGFKKIIQQYRTGSESNYIPMVLSNIARSKKDNRMIILLNNKKLIEAFMRLLNKLPHQSKLLVYTAENKESEDVQNFLRISDLESYDGIIGTNSIVEGLNINTPVEECEVHVIGDVSCERIEQVTNRWRKCNGTINVYHYTLDCSSLNPDDFVSRSANDFLGAAEDIARGFNKRYKLQDPISLMKNLNTYSKDNHDDSIYWNSELECFEVSYSNIDNELAMNRHMRTYYDYNYYKTILGSYGFNFRKPIKMTNLQDISETIATVEKEEKKKRYDVIELVRSQYDAKTNTWDINNDNHGAEILRNLVIEYISQGLKPFDVDTYLKRLKEDKNYWKYLSSDIKDKKYGNTIRDFILQELPNVMSSYKGKEGLTSDAKYKLANSVIQYVFQQRYNSNAKHMMGSYWGKMLSTDGSTVHLSEDNNSSGKVLSQYITLGKSISVRLNGTKTRFSAVEATTLTGFEL